jgi:hypothetical protein
MTDTIHLQGIGRGPARKAGELEPGDVLSWNYSPLYSDVVAVERVSPAFVAVTERVRKTGETHTRRLKADRLVACEPR